MVRAFGLGRGGTIHINWVEGTCSCHSTDLFIALAIQIHWTVAGKQIMYRLAMLKHRGANLDRLICMRYTVTPNSEQIFRRIKRSCIPCRKQSNKTVTQRFGNLRTSAIVPNSPFRVCCVDLSGPWLVLKCKKKERTHATMTTKRRCTYVSSVVCIQE